MHVHLDPSITRFIDLSTQIHILLDFFHSLILQSCGLLPYRSIIPLIPPSLNSSSLVPHSLNPHHKLHTHHDRVTYPKSNILTTRIADRARSINHSTTSNLTPTLPATLLTPSIRDYRHTKPLSHSQSPRAPSVCVCVGLNPPPPSQPPTPNPFVTCFAARYTAQMHGRPIYPKRTAADRLYPT